MNKEDTKKCIEIMQAYVDGKDIKWKAASEKKLASLSPAWNWENSTARYEVVEYEPQRGDTVLVRMNENCDWVERMFIVKHGEYWWCESPDDGSLHSWECCKEIGDEL